MSLEIDPVFTISSPYIQTSLIFRGLSSLIKQTEGDITLSRLSIHHYSAALLSMLGIIRGILITACSTRFVKVYCSDGVGLIMKLIVQ